jgi:hypothetical protein
MTQIIKIDPNGEANVSITSTWRPKFDGEEITEFLKKIGRPEDVRNRILQESLGILGGCINPNLTDKEQNVGLILGRVQSGKTSSFTAVSALAHDNGFKLVVVIAGTTQLLVDQTTRRLRGDLRLDEAHAFRRWTLCAVSDKNTATASAAYQNLRQRVIALSTGDPMFLGVPIVVVMKNTIHLAKLNKLFADLQTIDGVDLSMFPALIVDDEAHMHTPNVGKRNQSDSPSAVYERIRELANAFPRRSLLQYTATPQANLLMEIADELSPDFVRILEPGPGYVGGVEIFATSPSPHVRDIPPDQIKSNPSRTDPCPKSLALATANFLLVCAIDFVSDGRADHRSMLIHSDAKVGVHEVYEHWVSTICESWRILLDDPTREVPKEIVGEHANLLTTRPELAKSPLTIDELRPVILQVLNHLRIQSVNHRNDVGKVDFNVTPYWIINGGNILGVGYTVEGLVTTHMVRKPGVGMADTIQQRGRFFGYLNDRLKSVRVFITSEMAKRFKDYSSHEEGLRSSLKKYDSSHPDYDHIQKPTLKEWKRMFWLDPAMMPCRRQAQRLMLERCRVDKDGWVTQRHSSPSVASDIKNVTLVREFVDYVNNSAGLGWRKSDRWGGPADNAATTHLETRVPLSIVVELLSQLTLRSEDRNQIDASILAIEETFKSLEATDGFVVLVAQGGPDKTFRRTRTEPISLLQGFAKGAGGYVGDREVRDPEAVTLQIHLLDIVDNENRSEIVRNDMTAVAICLPSGARKWMSNILIQA